MRIPLLLALAALLVLGRAPAARADDAPAAPAAAPASPEELQKQMAQLQAQLSKVKDEMQKHAKPAAASDGRMDVHMMWGRLDAQGYNQDIWLDKEKERFKPVARWLTANGFHVVYDYAATGAAVKAAAQDPRTAIILWSSQTAEEDANQDGAALQFEGSAVKFAKGELIDAQGNPVPRDAFDNAPSLRQVVLGSCMGEVASTLYPHTGVHMVYFTATITMTDLFDYLQGPWKQTVAVDFTL